MEEDPLNNDPDLSAIFDQSLAIQEVVEQGLVKNGRKSPKLLSTAALPFEPEVRIPGWIINVEISSL